MVLHYHTPGMKYLDVLELDLAVDRISAVSTCELGYGGLHVTLIGWGETGSVQLLPRFHTLEVVSRVLQVFHMVWGCWAKRVTHTCCRRRAGGQNGKRSGNW